METLIGGSVKVTTGIVVVWMKLRYFVIQFFGILKFEACKNGNFITKHGKKDKVTISG